MTDDQSLRKGTVGQNRSRRRFLALSGVTLAGGLAGCSGDSSEGEDDGDGGGDTGGTATPEATAEDSSTTADESDDPTGGSLDCTSITDGYYAYEGDEDAFFFDVKLPSVFEGNTEFFDTEDSMNVQGNRPYGPDEDRQLEFQVFVSKDGSTEPLAWEDQSRYEEIATVSFDGETRPIVARTEEQGPTELLKVELPYAGDGETLYYSLNLSTEHRGHGTDGGELSTECARALNESSLHMAESLELTAETTFRSG